MKPFSPQSLPRSGIDWAGLIPAIGKANRAIAKYDGILHGIRNPDILLSPLMTREAVLSSRIEGTQATLNEVFQFEAGGDAPNEESRQDIHEIINYRRALREGERHMDRRPFSLNLLRRMHGILLDSVRGRDKDRGRFRRVQNWIGPPGTPMEEARYVPPAPGDLMKHLDNWEKYYHSEERDLLVQLAVIHAQFEIIHPFLDGNGRLGRMLVPLFLYEKGVLARPMFYMSAHLESRREDYYARLRDLNGRNSWNRWITFFLDSVIQQAQANASTASAILDLYERLKPQILSLTHSRYAVPLLDLFFARPVLQSSRVAKAPGMPSRQMVRNLLSMLRGAGILKVIQESKGRRPQVLALAELVNLCEGRHVL